MLLGQILNGLVGGALYALVAIGFTLVVGVLDKLNFAHPEVFTFGAFVGLLVLGRLPLPLAFLACLLVGGLIGVITEFIAFRRFTGPDARTTAALSSLALGLILTDGVRKVWGTEPVAMPQVDTWLNEGISIAGVRFLYLQFATLFITFLLMLGLHLLIHRTRIGRQIRAVAEAPGAALLLGINVRRVTQAVFFMSSALAAVAGLLLALRTGNANSDAGLTFGLKSLAIMAIGGMGDMRGAVLAGLGIGVLEAIAFYLGIGQWGEMIVWAAMLAVLTWRRGGLFFGSAHSIEARV